MTAQKIVTENRRQTANNRPSMAVLFGQPDHISTSFQTRQLVRALEPWFEPLPIRVQSTSHNHLRRHVNRVVANYLKPLVSQPKTDYLFYANDGVANLNHWQGTKLLYWYDATWDWSLNPPKKRQLVDWLRYRNVIAADYVFAVSHIQVEVARRLRPGMEDTVVYLPVGVDCQIFDPSKAKPEKVRQQFRLPEKTIVGYLGYLGIYGNSYAGQPLVEMAPKLLAECDTHFLIVGFGPGMAPFKKRIEELGVADHFTFTGFVADEMVPSCVAAMDICIDTLEEGFHSEARSETKLKQYMAMGRACVATAIGENCVDLDSGGCGVLVKPGSDNLLEGVKQFYRQPGLRAELGQAARQRALSHYHWPILAERLSSMVGIDRKNFPDSDS